MPLLKAYPSLKTGGGTHARAHLQGVLTHLQKRSDHHLTKRCTINISSLSLYNILPPPAQPARQGTGQPHRPQSLSEGTTHLESHGKEHRADFSHLPPVRKPRGSWADSCSTLLCQAALSGGARVCPSEPRD